VATSFVPCVEHELGDRGRAVEGETRVPGERLARAVAPVPETELSAQLSETLDGGRQRARGPWVAWLPFAFAGTDSALSFNAFAADL
jgi:hypothetical protein